MGSKKMILIIIGLLALLVVFFNVALNKIQTVEMDIQIAPDQVVTDALSDTVEMFLEYCDTPFIKDTTVSDLGMQVLFVDHLAGQAVLAHEGAHTPVDYQALDRLVIDCNSYFASISKQPTLIINCDPILGDVVERAIVACYQYEMCNLNTLDPENINYFENLNEDPKERFSRYQMIENLKKVYFEGQSLDVFQFYYHQWCDQLGQEYHEILDYDYYDGLKDYIEVNVKRYIDPDFDFGEYIGALKNEYGVYDKVSEYRLMGLLWCLVAEGKGEDIFNRSSVGSDQYKKMLHDTPLGTFDEEYDWHVFYRNYQMYMNDLSTMVESCQNDVIDIQPRELALTAESYAQTIQVGENQYIYLDYIARDDQMEIVQTDCMLARIEAYSILYYAD